jgi:hypothetical protein
MTRPLYLRTIQQFPGGKPPFSLNHHWAGKQMFDRAILPCAARSGKSGKLSSHIGKADSHLLVCIDSTRTVTVQTYSLVLDARTTMAHTAAMDEFALRL